MLPNKSSRTHFVVHTLLNNCHTYELADWQITRDKQMCQKPGDLYPKLALPQRVCREGQEMTERQKEVHVLF